MPQIEHNGPEFYYQVAWRRDIPGQQWNEHQLRDWQTSEFLVPNTPTFQPYKIKVCTNLHTGFLVKENMMRKPTYYVQRNSVAYVKRIQPVLGQHDGITVEAVG